MPKLNKGHVVTALVAGTLSMTVSHTALAAGFQLKEQSAQSQGNAFAGATATATDLSTIYFNPAGMTRLKGSAADMTVSYILPSSKLNLTSTTNPTAGASEALGTGDGGDAGVGAFVPAFYGMYDYSEDLKLGIAVNTPFGLSTSYDEGWAGRYHALDSEILTINVAPSVAYKVNKNLSIGAGAQIQYVQARLTKNITDIGAGTVDGHTSLTGDDIGFGGRLGILYEFNDDTRIGAAYHSRVRHNLEGRLEYENLSATTATVFGSKQTSSHAASAKLVTPDIFSLGASHDLNDQWTILGEVSRTQWTTFKDLVVLDENGVEDENIYENYRASHFAAIGGTYKMDENQTFRAGVAFDQGAVEDEHRTARIPDSDRYWLSLGYGYETENFNLNFGYSYIHAADASLNEEGSAIQGSFTGDYDSHVNILAVNATWKF